MITRQGIAAVAAKCFIRHQGGDGVVRRIPSPEEIKRIGARFPGVMVRVDVQPGTRLGDLMHQDSVSYGLGTLFIPAKDHAQIEERYQACLDALNFEIEPVKQRAQEDSWRSSKTFRMK